MDVIADDARNRWLVADVNADAIVAIDQTTGDRSVLATVSDPGDWRSTVDACSC